MRLGTSTRPHPSAFLLVFSLCLLPLAAARVTAALFARIEPLLMADTSVQLSLNIVSVYLSRPHSIARKPPHLEPVRICTDR